jgi:hypothetical protein
MRFRYRFLKNSQKRHSSDFVCIWCAHGQMLLPEYSRLKPRHPCMGPSVLGKKATKVAVPINVRKFVSEDGFCANFMVA